MPAFRFRPPEIVLSPALRWMLLRAFGPPGASEALLPGAPPDPAEALAHCRRFDLSGRVAARQGRARLQAELGEEGAAAFVRDQAAAAGQGMRLATLAERVAGLAAELGIPVVFLKFAALELSGLVAPGGRSACDVDVLVPAAQAGRLQDALRAQGFTGSAGRGEEHHLAALVGPAGVVEIHRVVLGVRLAGGGSAGWEDLAAADLLAALPGLPGRAAVPRPALLLAHAVVHGLGQHAWAARSYSLFKMVADFIDLGGVEVACRVADASDASDAADTAPWTWIARDVPPAEIAALQALAAALAAGAALGDWGESAAPPALLLRHLLAGRLDPGYGEALRLGLFRTPSDRPPARRRLQTLWRTLFLGPADVEALYGPQQSALASLGRRLWRPVELAGRLLRYGWRARKVRK